MVSEHKQTELSLHKPFYLQLTPVFAVELVSISVVPKLLK